MNGSLKVVRSERGGSDYWITVAVVPRAEKALQGALNEEEFNRLIDELAMHPEAGDRIPDSGGLRKLRAGCKGKGKSGGLRIVYFFYDLNMPLFVIAAYEKTKKVRYSETELASMRSLVDEIVNEYAAKNRRKAGSAA
ncbi:hypothetical protein [Euryhalocaulis caribicus]|uniref:hypothetical protein n=1 Tax=Euryhalocaulis caribicus TaxID=1161401 RepID=UPI0003B5E2D6|nr:hypothetical protein [Euryhalocaulis caribicus]